MFGYPTRKAAEDPVGGNMKRRRPSIGIVLGAGAARGWSHIGALQELVAMGVVPNIVVGASAGAVVGGCFAAGRLEQLEAFTRSLTKRRVFGLMDVSFSGGGLIGGAKLRTRLEESLGGINIEDLPIRFASVATEVGTGHEIWLKNGPLIDAICASYALPGIFAPVRWGGRWLMDGALVNPVPINVARALGADKVIAINISSDVLTRGTAIQDPLYFAEKAETGVEAGKKSGIMGSLSRGARLFHRPFAGGEDGVPGIASVMADAFNITQDRIMRSRLAGDPPDVLITARMTKIGLFEFHRADELIALGREAARKAIDEIREHIDLDPPASASLPAPSAVAAR
ncbi:patatin-like phospholipase family protein [Methylocapsa sp. S129]|uniref:patatin-like phospholipase family protein n=1 Tax=Methylocapsa sp. S129 TaxID=1641869 RepID=UPI00131DBEC7|nr:patatin-like phospholipase family protein [Methylocapsa sp. S129]